MLGLHTASIWIASSELEASQAKEDLLELEVSSDALSPGACLEMHALGLVDLKQPLLRH